MEELSHISFMKGKKKKPKKAFWGVGNCPGGNCQGEVKKGGALPGTKLSRWELARGKVIQSQNSLGHRFIIIKLESNNQYGGF